MKPSEIRKELHKYVDAADNETLHFISEALALYKAKKDEENKRPTDMSYPWAPTNEELFAQIEKSEENLMNGNYVSHEDVFAHIASLNAKI
jgi:hypothetical protein